GPFRNGWSPTFPSQSLTRLLRQAANQFCAQSAAPAGHSIFPCAKREKQTRGFICYSCANNDSCPNRMLAANGKKTPKRARSSQKPKRKPAITNHYSHTRSVLPLRTRSLMLPRHSVHRESFSGRRNAAHWSTCFVEM